MGAIPIGSRGLWLQLVVAADLVWILIVSFLTPSGIILAHLGS